MLLAILLIYFQTGTTDLQVLFVSEFSLQRQLLLWFAFFASFAVKVPMIPVHIWLPKHTWKPQLQVQLFWQGVLLKLGNLWFCGIQFRCSRKPAFSGLIYTLSIIGVIYASLTTLRQIDLKKIIAYSSVAHMGFVTLGLFSLNIKELGRLFLMLSWVCGFRFIFMYWCSLRPMHTRLVKYYGGLVHVMPLFSVFFLIFTMGNRAYLAQVVLCGEF